MKGKLQVSFGKFCSWLFESAYFQFISRNCSFCMFGRSILVNSLAIIYQDDLKVLLYSWIFFHLQALDDFIFLSEEILWLCKIEKSAVSRSLQNPYNAFYCWRHWVLPCHVIDTEPFFNELRAFTFSIWGFLAEELFPACVFD